MQSVSRVVQAVVAAGVQIALGVTILPGRKGSSSASSPDRSRASPSSSCSTIHGAGTSRPTARTLSLLHRYRKLPLLNAPNALIDAVRLNGINLIIGAGSVSALGQFSMAWKLTQSPMALIAGAVSQVYYQRMASALPGELRRVVVSVTRNALLIGAVPFAVLALLAPAIVPWFLGPQWQEAGAIVQALTPWLYLNVATAPLSNLFIVTGRQGTMLVFGIVYMLVPLTILWFLGADLVSAVWWMSGAMSVLLLVLIALSFSVATRFDAKRSEAPPA